MKWDLNAFLEFALIVYYYPYQLLLAVLVWIVLGLATQFNRVSIFVISFSAWFALVWTSALVLFVASAGAQSEHSLAIVGITLLPAFLFGYCVVSSLTTLRVEQHVDLEAPRAVKLIGVLMAAHVLHLVFTTFLTAFGTLE